MARAPTKTLPTQGKTTTTTSAVNPLSQMPNASPETLSTLALSSAYEWQMIRDILGGARQVRARGTTYLPKFPSEDQKDYDQRVRTAPFIGHFSDSLEGITSKPFTKQVEVKDDETPQIKQMAEDIDGAGRSLHSFAKDVFEEGVGLGLAGIFVDYPTIAEGATLADERAAGARPTFLDIPAEDILACFTEQRGGKRVVSHLRFRQRDVRRNGFREQPLVRVRSYTHDASMARPEYQVFERVLNGSWVITEHGSLSIDEIPFEPFVTGKIINGRYVAPLIALAHLQIEHYEQSSSLKNILLLAGFPMLSGNGVTPPGPKTLTDGTVVEQSVVVGPGIVLFAPPLHGSSSSTSGWKFVEPEGTSIEKLQAHVLDLERQMAKLGKQPLVRQTGNVTATGEAVNAARAHATAEAWANDLAKALTRCFQIAAKWLKTTTTAKVSINTDFGISDANGEVETLLNAAKEGKISNETLWDEWRRRNVLGPQFDPKVEAERMSANEAAATERAIKLAEAEAAAKAKLAAALPANQNEPVPGKLPAAA
ncbi:DUF4055 domain-containing protein [Phreatobacter sp. HK31-P]